MLVLTGCSSAGGPYPSLRPRTAEAIDPRVQPVRPINDRPVAAGLAGQLADLVAEARAGDIAFEPVVSRAEQLTSVAGAPQSEGWISAQEALSTAIAARSPTANAEADIDTISATAIQKNGGIAPNDLKAIRDAAAEVATIARGQTERIDAMKKRLGS